MCGRLDENKVLEGHHGRAGLSGLYGLQLGAYVNETFQAREGFEPDLFPKGVPIFMGHYHKPHVVQGTNIRYIGSPYQGEQHAAQCSADSCKVLAKRAREDRNLQRVRSSREACIVLERRALR